MKGLIRNNFYSVEGSLRVTILIGFLAMIAVAILAVYIPNNDTLLSGIITGMLGAFGGLAGSAIQKDAASKWNKFELTMPISRNDVMKARYLSFLLYILIGIFMAILGVLLFYAVSGTVNLQRMGYGFAFGITFAMSIPTFMVPLVLIFGIDKNEVLLMISIIISLGLAIGSSVIFLSFSDDLPKGNFVFEIGYFIFSSLLYFLSYLFSLCLYKKKEL